MRISDWSSDVCSSDLVTAARIGDTPERTRFVLEMSADLPYRVFTLPDPFRVVVDLPEVAWSLPDARQPQARGLISALRFGLFAPGPSRVVLAVTGPVLLQKVFVIPDRKRVVSGKSVSVRLDPGGRRIIKKK